MRYLEVKDPISGFPKHMVISWLEDITPHIRSYMFWLHVLVSRLVTTNRMLQRWNYIYQLFMLLLHCWKCIRLMILHYRVRLCPNWMLCYATTYSTKTETPYQCTVWHFNSRYLLQNLCSIWRCWQFVFTIYDLQQIVLFCNIIFLLMADVLYHLTWTWWRHQMETFSALLAICAGNSPVPGEFPTQRPVTRRFGVYFDLRPNKRLSKQSWGWWFETLSCSL